MVVENLQTTPFWEWLLGSGWYEGMLFQPLSLVIAMPLVVLLAAALVMVLRRGPGVASPRVAGIVGIIMGSLVLLAAGFVPLWALQLSGQNIPAVNAVLSFVIEPLGKPLRWLLGPGWYEGGLYQWLLVIGNIVASFFAIGWLVVTLRSGPTKATVRSGQALIGTLLDLARTSPRRVMALTWLAVRDSIRRRVIVVFAVFLILIMFAGWFINAGSDQPARLYLQVVLSWTNFLVLMLAWILSALSLPGDIKDHTIYTIVTKPVRATEIVLGRILGFTIVGTLLLAGMGVVSYVFTVRGLSHTHELTVADLHDETPSAENAAAKDSGSTPASTWKKGLTQLAHRHQHEVTVDPSGHVVVEMKQEHWHEVTVEGSGAAAVYKLGPPQGMLVARVPVYGKLRFTDRTGKDAEKGVNVGDEWTYRSFIAGGSSASALWDFEGITEDLFPESMFPDEIPLEMTIEVFRTHKGDIEKPILGTLFLRNPKTHRKVEVRNFLAKKFATDVQAIPRKLVVRKDGKTETLDLFRDLVTEDGRLEVGLQCMESGQFFGMAQADLYFRARDIPFSVNFFKGYLGIWLQMVLVLAIGVMFSTFLGGPVSMIATLGEVLGGLFSSHLSDLAAGQVIGGGPFESFIRIVTQQNLISEMEPGLQTSAALMSDHVLRGLLWIISTLLPAFGSFDFANYVACGFDVGGTLLMKCLFRAAAYLLPLIVAGYFFLKIREVAK